jgi:putrescine aminotransferase
MPICAVCSTEEIFHNIMYPNPFLQTTTTGGGALACSAAIAAINITLRDRLWEAAGRKGHYIMARLCEMVNEFPQVYKDITGKGLLIGQHFHTPEIGYKVAAGLFQRGVLVSGTLTNASSIRIEPALTIEQEIIDEGLYRLHDTVSEVARTL